MKKLRFIIFCYLLIIPIIKCLAQSKIDSMEFYSKLVEHPKNATDLYKSYAYFDQLLTLPKINNHLPSKAYCLIRKASIELKKGFFTDSENNLINTLKIIDQYHNNDYLKKIKPSVYNQLGILYRKQKNYTEAFKQYEKALITSKSIEDSLIVFNNIGNLFKEKGDFKEALKILNKAKNLSKKSNNLLKKSLIIDNLGITKSKINKNNGLIELKQALILRKQKNDLFGLYQSYINLTKYYYSLNEKKYAKKYALKSLEISQKLQNSIFTYKSLGLLIDLRSYEYINKFKKINDSINKVNLLTTNNFALLKYDVEKQTKKTQEAELNAEKEKQRSLMFQFIGLFIAILAIAGYFIHKAINKKKIVENVIETEGRISKTVHDVVANDVYHIITKIQTGLHSKEELLDDLDVVYQKARKIAHETFVIDNEINFGELLNDLCNSYKSASVNIITNNLKAMHWESVSIHKKNMLYRVLQELMTNMTKYSKATLVTLNFKEKGKQISIIYKDNGIGTHLIKKNGLINAENRIKSVGGSIIFESAQEKGFKTLITI